MRTLSMFPLVLALALPAAYAEHHNQGDHLAIETQTSAVRPSHLPKHGMSMSQVQAGFGKPESRQGPVGKPPITRWHYANFTVVFEHSHVIHTVVSGAPAAVYHRDELQLRPGSHPPIDPPAPAPAPAPDSASTP